MHPSRKSGLLARVVALLSLTLLTAARLTADVIDSAAEAQRGIEASIVELYGGEPPRESWSATTKRLERFAAHLQTSSAKALWSASTLPTTPPDTLASGQILGRQQALLQHVYALEMLHQLEQGQLESAREWRALIQIPKYADAVQGVLALQHGRGSQKNAAAQLLAREYLVWQTTLVREKLDAMQRLIGQQRSTPEMIATRSAEIQTLAHFPQDLLKRVLPGSSSPEMSSDAWQQLVQASPATLPAAMQKWAGQIRQGLPNLLTPEDVTRRERLLVKLLKLIPVEYAAGVRDGEVVIPIEYREAETFTIQSRQILEELRSPWERTRADIFATCEPALREALENLEAGIQAKADSSVVEREAGAAMEILADHFGISLRRQGKASEVVAETLLDVRTLLSESHAAARAGNWADAESLRLEAYTTFDLEIETRTMPRDPELALRAERLFLDGTSTQPGIKAALDARVSGLALAAAYEAALAGMNECSALLQMSISPLTAIYTTVSVVTREGLEAVVILAALLAGLRGGENQRIRRNIGIGVAAALVASVMTFVVSRLIITSLSRHGETLEAVVSILAVIVLLIVTNWVFHKMYWVEWNARLRSLTRAVNTGNETARANLAMIGVGFLTIYREGFETVLFLQSLLLEAGLRPVLIGLGIGLAIVSGLGLGVFYIGAKLPYRKLLIITGMLVITVLVTFLGSTVRLFQTVGWLSIHPITWLEIPSWMGTWLGIYPSWEGLLIPPLGLVYVGTAWLWVKWRSARAQASLIRATTARHAPIPSP